jgi:hypothetical protein
VNYTHFHIHKLNTFRVVFCSKRLAEKMLNKSIAGKWITTYFRLKFSKLKYVPEYTLYSINNKGLLVLIKD